MKSQSAIIALMMGKTMKRHGQDYEVIYKDGEFIIKSSGTLFGSFKKMEELNLTWVEKLKIKIILFLLKE